MTHTAIRDAADLAADRTASYQELVHGLADDREVPATEVLAVAEAAGRTLDDLQADVDRVVGRRLAAEAIEALPDAQKAVTDAQRDRAAVERQRVAEHARLKREFDAATAQIEAEHATRLQPIEAKLADAKARIEAARDGRKFLQQTAAPELVEKLADLRFRREMGTVAAKLADCSSRLAHLEKIISADLPPVPEKDFGVLPRDLEAFRLQRREAEVRRENAERAAGPLREEIARLRAATEDLDRQVEAAELALLVV